MFLFVKDKETTIMNKAIKDNNMEKEKSDIIVRSVVIENGKEKVVEEKLDELSSGDSLVSEDILNDIFDSIYSE